MARLDFFLMSEELLTMIESVYIKNGYRTDHSIVHLEIKISDTCKGGGFWKFNTSLLKDNTYVNKVKEVIHNLKQDYALQPDFHNMRDEDILLSIGDDLFLEMLLLKIREMTIPYSSKLKKDRDRQTSTFLDQINFVKSLYEESKCNVIGDILNDLNNDFEQYRHYQMQGLILRTKAKWIEQGEKPSKYFCALEKRNFVNKNITKLTSSSNDELTKQEEILQEIKVSTKIYTKAMTILLKMWIFHHWI